MRGRPSRTPRPSYRKRVVLGIVVVAVVAVHVLALRGTEFRPQLLVAGWQGMARFLGEAVPPDLSWTEVVRPSLEATLVTLWIGLLGGRR